MGSYDLDEVDRQILHLLQENARSISNDSIGEEVGVSASTVRNRIGKLKNEGIIRGFHPEIDYDAADYPLHYLFLCDAPATEREAIVERVLAEIPGVVRVAELVDTDLNVLVEAVATDARNLNDINDRLGQFGLTVNRGEVFAETYVRPFDHFGAETQSENDT